MHDILSLDQAGYAVCISTFSVDDSPTAANASFASDNPKRRDTIGAALIVPFAT
ncbi:MAG: hypothetical protein ACI8V4_002239, partial [Ilumatobacter sp.]